MRTGDQGLNPASDGQVIRVPIPPLTEERRKEFVKLVKQKAEEARVAIRNIRRDEIHRIDQMTKEGGVTEDDSKRGQRPAAEGDRRPNRESRRHRGPQRSGGHGGLGTSQPYTWYALGPWTLQFLLISGSSWMGTAAGPASRGHPASFGHRAGVRAIKRVLQGCEDLGVKVLSVYAFSTENWSRPRAEVRALMRLFHETMQREIDEMHRRGVRIVVSGRRDELSSKMRERIDEAMERTARNTGRRAQRLPQLRRPCRDRRCRAQADRGRA